MSFKEPHKMDFKNIRIRERVNKTKVTNPDTLNHLKRFRKTKLINTTI